MTEKEIFAANLETFVVEQKNLYASRIRRVQKR
jgi:hypothetical protein